MSGEYRKYLANNMTPEQRANAEELYNELRKFAEPPNDPFENMPIEKVNEYLRQHGYDPDQVGLRGRILGKALIENVDLRAQVAALQKALSEIEAITAAESPMTYQWVLRVMRKVNAIARSARVGGGA